MDNCYRCPPGYGVHQNCTRHQDTDCHPCQPGHYSSHHSAHRPCYPCSLCGLGLYIAHECTPNKDTVCDSCHTYKGPHNENFYQKCVRPLVERMDNMSIFEHSWSEENLASQVKGSKLSDTSFTYFIIGIAVVGALSIVLLTICVKLVQRVHNKMGNSRHPYEAVATQEAVMV